MTVTPPQATVNARNSAREVDCPVAGCAATFKACNRARHIREAH